MSSTEETGPGLEPPAIDPRASKGEFYTPPPGVTVGSFAQHPAYRPLKPYLESVAEHLTPGVLTDLVLECHGASWRAGWWHDLRTGKPLDRNGGELLMLMVSELSEAAEGDDHDLHDDKLPHRKMVEVEIADFEIRLFDFCGGFRLDIQAAYDRSSAFEPLLTVVHPVASTPALWRIARHVCDAMEAHRKGKTDTLVLCLARALRLSNWLAEMRGFNIPAARAEKLAFNARRADHKPEARLAPGGKTY